MSNRVRIDVSGNIATVTLTRPEKRNALDLDMINAIVSAGEGLATRRDIRAVVLCGDGAAFSAGLDTSTFQLLIGEVAKAGGVMTRTHGLSNLFQRTAMVWADLPMPVIAAVHGYAFGGAFQIMLGADIRIAAPDTKFSIMEGKWGLVPDMGGMVLMHHLARGDVIRRLTYTAEVFAAKDAQNWGFITEISDDPLARATALANEIAARSPDAVHEAKALITATQDMDVVDALLLESKAQERLIGSPNQIEALMAGFEKRSANFKD
ncbi:enoyl-CoA hydratase [Marinosulfonomonas sp. PRT-SC04]|nr:enoyl-CoA hydratase [Marinosulfonomonas sp. PRT-SC04]